MPKSKRNLAVLALLYNAVIWGSAFPIIKPIFDYISPTQMLYFRYLVAGVVALPLFLHYYFTKKPTVSKVIKPWIVELLGLAIPILILYEGLSRTSALEASLIGATGPIFVILGGVIFLRESQERHEWQGLAISLLGSLILILEPIWNGHNFIGSDLSGNLLILCYNLAWAIYAVFAKRYYKSKPPLQLVSLTYLGTALIHGLILNNSGSLPPLHILYSNLDILLPILYMAIPGGIIASIFYLYAASKIEVSEANLFTYLNGVVAIPASYLLLGETPSLSAIIAITIIAYGVIRAETRTK